jgi:hypothetical protein
MVSHTRTISYIYLGVGGRELQTIWDNMRGGGGYVQIKKSCRPIPGQGAEQEG